MFCTGKHLSVGRFTQFCVLTKKGIAFEGPFVYNVFIRVSEPNWKEPLPERSKNNNVYRQLYP